MNSEALRTQLVHDFGIESLSYEEQEPLLLEIAKTIQKQFLLDVYDIVGDAHFDALQASATMGDEFYNTTLKHMLPNYDEVFRDSRQKVVGSFKKE